MPTQHAFPRPLACVFLCNVIKGKWPKKFGWQRHGPLLWHWCQGSKIRASELSWTWPDVIGLLRQVAYELIPADQEHFKSLAWHCMIARWHHWRHKRSHVPSFRRLFNRLPNRISTVDLHHWILRKKKTIRSEFMILKCTFPSMYEICRKRLPVDKDSPCRQVIFFCFSAYSNLRLNV